ncbi:MAG: DUF2254 domain-containing protein [Pseudomonadales bacterium]
MATWLRLVWEQLNSSLWFLPGLMSLAAIVLALVCARLDELAGASTLNLGFLYHGTVESARSLLSTVAGSMITVAGVSFSVTMVALSLASSQLGPRLLVNFMRDRGNQVVLGGFIATFLFCLLALGSTPETPNRFVSVSASVALLLAVVSLMLLIYFIHHIAASMQADHVIRAVAADVDLCLRSIFPDDGVEPDDPSPPEFRAGDASLSSERTGYLQGIDEAGLMKVAVEHDLRLRVLRRPGHYLTRSIPLIQVAGRDVVDADLARRIQRAFIVGGSRTAEQDPEFGIHQLVEIALRALSPGINDPFTATTCIDHLTGILCTVAAVPERPPLRWDGDGSARLQLDAIDFEGVLDAAFNQIRQAAAGTASVSIRLLEALSFIAAATRHPERLAAVERQARMVYEANAERLIRADRQALEARLESLESQLEVSAKHGTAAGSTPTA